MNNFGPKIMNLLQIYIFDSKNINLLMILNISKNDFPISFYSINTVYNFIKRIVNDIRMIEYLCSLMIMMNLMMMISILNENIFL